MTTPNLQEVFTVTLGQHELKMTPTLGMLRHMGNVEERATADEEDEEVDGQELLGMLYSTYESGTKRHHAWSDVMPVLEDFTFMELILAVREGMTMRLGEIKEARSQSP